MARLEAEEKSAAPEAEFGIVRSTAGLISVQWVGRCPLPPLGQAGVWNALSERPGALGLADDRQLAGMAEAAGATPRLTISG